MSLENKIDLLCAAITENTSVLREVLAAGGDTKVVHTITPVVETPKPAKKKAEKVEPVAVVEVEPEQEPAAEMEVPVVEETPEQEPATEETPALDPEALITQITDLWRTKLTEADPGRKMTLKEKFPELRAKWGLAADAKLITLAPTPEKLAGLLADIKAL